MGEIYFKCGAEFNFITGNLNKAGIKVGSITRGQQATESDINQL